MPPAWTPRVALPAKTPFRCLRTISHVGTNKYVRLYHYILIIFITAGLRGSSLLRGGSEHMPSIENLPGIHSSIKFIIPCKKATRSARSAQKSRTAFIQDLLGHPATLHRIAFRRDRHQRPTGPLITGVTPKPRSSILPTTNNHISKHRDPTETRTYKAQLRTTAVPGMGGSLVIRHGHGVRNPPAASSICIWMIDRLGQRDNKRKLHKGRQCLGFVESQRAASLNRLPFHRR